MNRSIMLVFAHPDDESFGMAGTISKYTSQGVPVDLVCATKGEKGTRVGVPRNIATGTAREAELRKAAKVTGVREIYFLGYMDAELDKVPPAQVRDKLLSVMRRVLPEVVITFGPDGITGHADHIAIGKAATAAFERLAAAGGARKLYYVTLPASLVEPDSGMAARPDDEVTTVIDAGDFVKQKIAAISAHRSQQDSRDFLEGLDRDNPPSWLSREYLYLARPGTSARETDLFQ